MGKGRDRDCREEEQQKGLGIERREEISDVLIRENKLIEFEGGSNLSLEFAWFSPRFPVPCVFQFAVPTSFRLYFLAWILAQGLYSLISSLLLKEDCCIRSIPLFLFLLFIF
uniref:Uncharacterized protein n=1 Tax=Nicotiana tabacum TaxID=4097 RepID=A0A1S3YGS9_TOBAC|nr:PREDICTED: uncharacterized protein LOC107775948 [Nicotiana tabacum]